MNWMMEYGSWIWIVLETEGDEELHFFAASTGTSWKVYQSAMGKRDSIWNKAHRSSAAAEAVQDIANMRFSVPCFTRWSSEYIAISKLIRLTSVEGLE